MAVALSRTRSEHFQLHEHEERVLVPVVYYLTSNGQLQHPHFVEVPLSSSQGLFLRDVLHRLHLLRGQAIASHYSWSSKRCYKNGYVWHDLEENDLIHPVHGGEYILKGSEIIESTSFSSPSLSKSTETSSFSSVKSNIIPQSSARNRRRNQSWGAIDLNEYKVYKTAESTHEFATAAADASTQTDDKRRRSKAVINKTTEIQEEESTELSRGDISPPQSNSSPETLESLIKTSSSSSSSSLAVGQAAKGVDRTAGNFSSGRMKASSVLMSLISCGSISVKDHGLSLITYRKPRPPRDGIEHDNEGITMEIMERNVSSSFAKMALEDKEYFSGSIIENNKKDDHQLISLKRSASCNAERSSQLKLGENEAEGVKPKRVPRKPKA